MSKLYKKTSHTYKIKYLPELLWKYHELSKELAHSDSNYSFILNNPNTTKEQKELFSDLSAKAKDRSIRETEITSNFYWEVDDVKNGENYQLIYPLKDYDQFTESELLHYHTLLYIVKKYVEKYLPYEVHIDLGLFGLYFCLHERLSRQTRSDAVDYS